MAQYGSVSNRQGVSSVVVCCRLSVNFYSKFIKHGNRDSKVTLIIVIFQNPIKQTILTPHDWNFGANRRAWPSCWWQNFKACGVNIVCFMGFWNLTKIKVTVQSWLLCLIKAATGVYMFWRICGAFNNSSRHNVCRFPLVAGPTVIMSIRWVSWYLNVIGSSGKYTIS